MKLYRHKSRLNTQEVCVVEGNPHELDLRDYAELVLTYHVQEVEEGEHDYISHDGNGRKLFYKFTSESGREMFKNQKRVMPNRSIDRNVITNPDCLIALGLESRITYLKKQEKPSYPLKKKTTPSKEKELNDGT